MSWVVSMFTSSLGRKYVMSLTGLFLCTFLVIHLTGNLLTLVPDQGLTFNAFTHFMENNILVGIIEYVLFAGFIIHIIQSITITLQNRKARPVGYAVNAKNQNSSFSSRNMGILGTIIFIFLVIHLRDFFYELRFHEEEFTMDANGNVNLFQEVVKTFSLLAYTVLYVVAMLGLGFHLWHGFSSAFRSVGIMHSKYTPAIRLIGKVYTLVITSGFIIIPLYWYFKQL
ncbi:MAG: succinate dehydrogenase cytochrome b subunit [Chitinophagales bacterium]